VHRGGTLAAVGDRCHDEICTTDGIAAGVDTGSLGLERGIDVDGATVANGCARLHVDVVCFGARKANREQHEVDFEHDLAVRNGLGLTDASLGIARKLDTVANEAF
jgi:hypothetical protein